MPCINIINFNQYCQGLGWVGTFGLPEVKDFRGGT